jgi:hypothetical protein
MAREPCSAKGVKPDSPKAGPVSRELAVSGFKQVSKNRIAAALALALSSLLLQGSIGRSANFDQRVLAAHNRERTAAGIPPLVWDDRLVASASRWGAHLAQLGDLEHYPDVPGDPDPEGENLWLGTSGYFTPEEMVGAWIEEKRHFRPGRVPANSRTGDFNDIGHYTQLMWRSTDRVGCALARGSRYDVLVCRYLEGGNVVGERPF